MDSYFGVWLEPYRLRLVAPHKQHQITRKKKESVKHRHLACHLIAFKFRSRNLSKKKSKMCEIGLLSAVYRISRKNVQTVKLGPKCDLEHFNFLPKFSGQKTANFNGKCTILIEFGRLSMNVKMKVFWHLVKYFSFEMSWKSFWL